MVIVAEQFGCKCSKSVPCLMISRNSPNGAPPSGRPVLSGVKLQDTICGEVGPNVPKSDPPPR